MSFGSGIHYCLGAALARLEGQVCFGRLLTRFRHIELARAAGSRIATRSRCGASSACRWR